MGKDCEVIFGGKTPLAFRIHDISWAMKKRAPGCLGYVVDYTAQLIWGLFHKPLPVGFMYGIFTYIYCKINHSCRQIHQFRTWLHMSNEKKRGCLGYCNGWNPTQLYGCFQKWGGGGKSWIFIGFSIIFTIHFGGFPPIFGNTHLLTLKTLSHLTYLTTSSRL